MGKPLRPLPGVPADDDNVGVQRSESLYNLLVNARTAEGPSHGETKVNRNPESAQGSLLSSSPEDSRLPMEIRVMSSTGNQSVGAGIEGVQPVESSTPSSRGACHANEAYGFDLCSDSGDAEGFGPRTHTQIEHGNLRSAPAVALSPERVAQPLLRPPSVNTTDQVLSNGVLEDLQATEIKPNTVDHPQRLQLRSWSFSYAHDKTFSNRNRNTQSQSPIEWPGREQPAEVSTPMKMSSDIKRLSTGNDAFRGNDPHFSSVPTFSSPMKRSSSLGSRGSINSGATNKMTLRSQSIAPHSTQGLPHHHLKRQPSVTSVASTHYQELVEEEDNWGHWWRTVVDASASVLLGFRNPSEELDEGSADHARFRSRVEAYFHWNLVALVLMAVLCSLLAWRGLLRAAITAAICVACLVCAVLVLQACMRFRLLNIESGVWWLVQASRMAFVWTPIAMYVAAGGVFFSTDIFLWNCAGPLASILILSQKLTRVDVLLLVLRNFEIALVCLLEFWGVFGSAEGMMPEQTTFAYDDWGSEGRLTMQIFTHACLPVAVALAFRRSVKEFLRWREVHLGVSEQLHDQREFTEQLLHSAVPPRRAQLLRDTDPSEWHKQSSDDYEECTIVQMDITGFTALSSDLRADELLDLVNAIFTSIDKAAELIGKVWKVETIGDCYQVIIGGPYPCDDHVQRGLELGISILHILGSVSDRVSVPVMGRIGLHTGRVTAAVVGTVLPRYLVYGPDVIITRHMEESGTKNTIQLTEASRQHLPADKWHLEGPHPYSTNGAVGQSYTACFGPQNFEVLLAAARLRNPILEEFLSHFGVQPLLHMPSPGNSPLAAVVRSSCLGSPPQATFSRVASSASHVSESWRARSGESSDVSRKVSLESPTPSASACHEDSNVQLHGATYDKDEAILKSKLLLSDCGAVTSSNAPADQSSSISALRSDSAEQISGNESWMAIKTNGIRNRFERDVLVRQVAGDGQDRAGPDRARPRSNSDSTAEDRGRSPAVTFGSLLRTTPKSLGQVVSEGMEHADLCMHLPGSVNASAPDEGADGTACNPTPLPDPFSDALFGMEVTPAFKLGSPRSGDAVVRRQGSAPLVNEGLSLQGLKSPEQDHRRAQQGDSQTSEDLQRTPSANTFENEKNGSRTISDGGAGNSSTKAKAGAAAIHGRPTGLTVTDLRKMKASAERGTLRDEDLQFLRVKSSLLAGAASNRLVENGASSMRLSRFRELRHELEQFTRTETSGGAAVAGRVGRDEPLSSEAERRSALQGSEKVIVATPGLHRGAGTGVGIGGEATVGGMSFTWRGKPRVGLAGGPGRIPDAGEGKSLDVAGTAASGNSWVQSSGLERSLGPLAPNGTGAPSRSGSALQPVLSCRSNPQPAEPCQCRPTSCPTSASSERASSLHMGNAPAQLPSPSRKQQPLAERKSAMRDSQRDLLCAVGSTLPGSRATLVATAGSSQRLDLAEGLRAGTEVSAHAAGTASPAAFSSFRGSFLFRGSFPQTAEAAARTSSDTTGPLRARPRKIGGGTELTPVISGEDVENERPDVMGKENRDMRQQDLRVVILRSLLLCVGLGGTLLAVLWHREFLHELQEFGGPPWELQYTLMVAGGISWVVYSLVSLALGLLAIRDPWLLAPHWIQSLAQLVLFAGPVLFSMTYCGYIAKRLVVWSFVAILLQCCSYYFSNLRFLTVIGLYTAFVAVANHAAASHVVTDEVLPTMFMQDNLSLLAISLLHHIVPATALFLAVALSVKQLLGQWEQNVSSLDALEAELILETTVLHALVPSDIAARLVQGREACIADTSTNAAVLFVYLLDSDELIARFGVRSVVDWINSVFKCFDGVIQPEGGSSSGCTKIETFSQFYLAVAWDQHPELLPEDYRTYPDPAVAAIRACVLMAQSVAHVRRPDGKPTELRVGVNSGPLCAGVIGDTSSPRFSVFGDTVNLASRMATTSECCQGLKPFVHISEACYQRLAKSPATRHNSPFVNDVSPAISELQTQMHLVICGRDGKTMVKGKGHMQTYVASLLDSPSGTQLLPVRSRSRERDELRPVGPAHILDQGDSQWQ